MREILFRGKRVDNGKWIEGFFFQIWERTYILWGTTNGAPNMIEVDPLTVGQFTGLTEKNGKKIFDGDIACAGSEGIIAKCEVKRRIDGIYYMNPNRKTVWYMIPDNAGKTTVEILGNIHDNPELLGGAE